MRILKANDSSLMLSEADKKAIIGEVFNIMCGARLFDINGEFLGVKPSNATQADTIADHIDPDAYVSVRVDGVTITAEPCMGFIILPTGSKERVSDYKSAVEEYLIKNIPAYEKQYLAGTPYENYLNKHKATYLDVFSTTYVKPASTLIRSHSQIAERNENKQGRRNNNNKQGGADTKANTRIQFAFDVDPMLERYATFTWYIIDISAFEFEITNTNREFRVAERMCSVFYDFMDITSFPHGWRTMEFHLSDLKFTKNFIAERIKFSSHHNPIAEELKTKSANTHGRPKYVDISREILVGELKQFQINDAAQASVFVCSVCTEELYDDNYICVSRINNDMDDSADNKLTGDAVCVTCMHTGQPALRDSPKRIYRVMFPMTIMEKIDRLGCSARKKDILKCATSGCIPVTITENGITIKYVALANRYIVISSKIHGVKFTRFAANIGEGVKLLSTYESDKMLD